MLRHPTQNRPLTPDEQGVYDWHQQVMREKGMTPREALDHLLAAMGDPSRAYTHVLRSKDIRQMLLDVEDAPLKKLPNGKVKLSDAATVVTEWFWTLRNLGYGPQEALARMMSQTQVSSKTWELLNDQEFRTWLTTLFPGYPPEAPGTDHCVVVITTREAELLNNLARGEIKTVPITAKEVELGKAFELDTPKLPAPANQELWEEAMRIASDSMANLDSLSEPEDLSNNLRRLSEIVDKLNSDHEV